MAGDAVLVWNQVAVEATRVERLPPPRLTRALAMVQGAVFDAVNGIERDYVPYLVKRHAPSWASPEAAAAVAAHDVLLGLMPARQATLDVALASSLAAIDDGRAEDAGVAFGQLVARRMLAERQDDGSNDTAAYIPGAAPDDWQPTPPGFAAALLPQFATVETFAISSPEQFRSDSPPALTSARFTQAFDEVKAIGAANSTTRTAEQTEIAVYWAGLLGTVQSPGQWNRIARGVADAQHNTLGENARLFALLNFAMADAMITSWNTKFEYNYVRPVTAIRNAANDGNPATTADPTWTPLLVTPPHPSYNSGHSTLSGSAATILADFFGTDAIAFTDTAESAPGGSLITRSFDGFWDAAREAASSRLYAGIHWSFDNEAGLDAGRNVGSFIADNLLRPRGRADRDGDDRDPDRDDHDPHNDGRGAATCGVRRGRIRTSSNAHRFFSDSSGGDVWD
jgi:membrane-associated phospholipid phosphatase